MLSVILLDSCRGENLIVVDNTHVKRWEMAPYFEMAETYRYAVILLEPRTPWRNNPKVQEEGGGMAPYRYFEMVETYLYVVLLVKPRTPWRNNPKVGGGGGGVAIPLL
jgi:hypothetical protein